MYISTQIRQVKYTISVLMLKIHDVTATVGVSKTKHTCVSLRARYYENDFIRFKLDTALICIVCVYDMCL